MLAIRITHHYPLLGYHMVQSSMAHRTRQGPRYLASAMGQGPPKCGANERGPYYVRQYSRRGFVSDILFLDVSGIPWSNVKGTILRPMAGPV
jgi:hypothetical protein